MFIGHFAPALVAATHKEAPGLPVLMVAGQLVDWGFFALLLTGAEAMRITPGTSVMSPLDLYHMPYTHSLVGSGFFAIGFAMLVWLATRNRTGALIAGLVVLSHWFLDLLVHVPDLTIAGSPPKLGLGLWNHPFVEMPLELVLTLGSLWLYARAKKPAVKPLAVLAVVLLALQLFNWFGGADSGSTSMMAVMALLAFAVVTLLAWWVARSEARKQAG
jgi:hypothetical protein